MTDSESTPGQERPFIGVHLKCCNVYVRAYVNAAGDAFTSFCPRYTAQVHIPIVAEGGSSSRFFNAG